MDDTTQSIVTQAINALVRHGLTTLAGMLVGWGVLDTSQSANFVAIGAGAAIFLVSYLWSLAQKKATLAHVEKLQTKVEVLKDKLPISQGGNK